MPSNKIRPKVVLDETMLKELNKFYSSNWSESILGNECFSHPDMDSHICCTKTKREGDQECDYCKNIVGRRCHITCHVHHFCLGVFAYRLGIGGDDLLKAVKFNTTKTSYNKLYNLILEALGGGEEKEEIVCSEAQDLNKITVEEKAAEGSDDDMLISVREASDIYGCGYYNMYSHVKRGFPKEVKKDGKIFVKKSEVIQMKKSKSEDKIEKSEEESNKDSEFLVCVCGKKTTSKPGLTLHRKKCVIYQESLKNE